VRKIATMSAGAVLAAVLTHGMITGSQNLSYRAPFLSYAGVFQHAVYGMNNAWSTVHGWPSLRDCEASERSAGNRLGAVEISPVCRQARIWEFARFYHLLLHLICPLAGFLLFVLLFPQRMGARAVRPLAIAVLYTSLYLAIPPVKWLEVACSAAIALLMMWSVGPELHLIPRTRRNSTGRTPLEPSAAH